MGVIIGSLPNANEKSRQKPAADREAPEYPYFGVQCQLAENVASHEIYVTCQWVRL
jgi:hypothetical protein